MKNTMKTVKQDSFSHTYLLYFIPGKSTSTTTEYEYLKQQHSNKKGQHRSSNGTQNKETRKHLHSNQLTTATTTTREKQLRRQEKPLQQKRITYWKSPALTHTHTVPYTHTLTPTGQAHRQCCQLTRIYVRGKVNRHLFTTTTTSSSTRRIRIVLQSGKRVREREESERAT